MIITYSSQLLNFFCLKSVLETANFRVIVLRGQGYSTKFYKGRLRPVVQPLTPAPYSTQPFLTEKVPIRIPFIHKWYPFHKPSLELCIPFTESNRCKSAVFENDE